MAKNVVLGVGAHPDDMEFTASGTIALLIKQGWEGYYLICTDGSRGSRHHNFTQDELAKTRKSEQETAGKILGLTDILYLDHRDTELECNPLFKAQIVRVIRMIKPTIVITMNPTFYYSVTSPWNKNTSFVNHTDHRAAGLATMDAVFPMSRDRASFPEHEQQGLSPHKVSELWFTSFEKKEHVVDITSTLDTKLKALASHKSQIDNFSEVEQEVKGHARFFAEGESFEYGESFARLILKGD